MATKHRCKFCGRVIEPGTGIMVVEVSGAVSFYCSSKCEKNSRLGRKPRRVKWTEEYRKEKQIRVEHLKEEGKAAKGTGKGEKSSTEGGPKSKQK